jgi:SAM-dependent methyltransferase
MWLRALPAWAAAWHGCDVDTEAIAWLRAQGLTRVAICGDVPPLPYDDRFFGGLFAFSVLTHVHPERHREWLAELHRVTAPGGLVFLTQHGEGAAQGRRRAERALRRRGWAWLERHGHYKSAAFVTEPFGRATARDLFDVERFQARGYQTQDAYLLRRR